MANRPTHVALATATVLASGMLALGLAQADVLKRPTPVAGTVIARKTGEEARFIEVPSWRSVDVSQDLLPGDVLRTNAQGQLAVLFADRTQMRIGRNTVLEVKAVGAAADTKLDLKAGTIWTRAERGGQGLTVDAPAASAAIRGTDWTMSVDASGRTSIIVLEGEINFFNGQGSVQVRAGEAAAASIGSAPTKIVIVSPDDREQMLFHLSLRNGFSLLRPTPLAGPELRAARARLEKTPPTTTEDRLLAAEIALSTRGRAAARDELASIAGQRLSRRDQARRDLVEGLILAGEGDHTTAATLLQRAAPHLDADRGAAATFGAYFARALADRGRVEAVPRGTGGPQAVLARAWATGFLEDVPAAIAVLRDGEARYPQSPLLPAARAHLALLLNDRGQIEEAINKALALDPDDGLALEARANYRFAIKSDIDGALADLTRVTELTPGSTTAWNLLGLVESARDANQRAEAALLKAIALDPADPVSRANLAFLYLEQDRTAEAKTEIDAALNADPSFDVALVARGRYKLQTGDLEGGIQDLLAGTTANPGYAQGLLLLAGSYYEAGQREPAAQALENSERLDPNDPVTAVAAATIAIDAHDSDAAIRHAQEALRRFKARGGRFAAPSASPEAGSLLNSAFRLQGLNAWGRYYGDVVFDPFSGGAIVDQVLSASPNPFAADIDYGSDQVDPSTNRSGFPALFQGLMFSPEMLSGRSRSANLFRRPFLEGAVTGGLMSGSEGWTGTGEVQAYSDTPIPVSLFTQIKGVESEEPRRFSDPGGAITSATFKLDNRSIDSLTYLTARPTPSDRLVAYASTNHSREAFADAITRFSDPALAFDLAAYDRTLKGRGAVGGLGWSRDLGYRNTMNVAAFASDQNLKSSEVAALFATPFPIGARTLDASTTMRSYTAALNHTWGIGAVTLRNGLEGGQLDQSRREDSQFATIFSPLTRTIETRDVGVRFARAYADVLYDVSPNLKLEAGAFASFMTGDLQFSRFEPRAGLAWAPVEGQWLRAGYLRETFHADAGSLAPIGIVGLQTNQPPLDIGGYSDTIAARWDAEWTSWMFTSIDYQHQKLHDLSIPVPGSIVPLDAADGLGDGEVDRVSATANLHLGQGFGLFATGARSFSRNTTTGASGHLPFIPDWSGRAGLTFVHPTNVQATVSATYIGERTGDAVGTRLDPYWTLDASLSWQPFDKRIALEANAYNLLDETFEVAPSVAGWGRSFVGTVKVRF